MGRDLLALHGRVEQAEAALADEGAEAVTEALLRVHAASHVERVREAVERAGEEDDRVALDADTMVSAASWDAASGSVEAALAAVEAVAGGRYRNAFVAQRPPGHHATPRRAMGFCLFNGAAVAARHLQARGLAERILVLDWDVHHGNGTQDAFYEDPTVFYLSLHQSPWYPGTGAAEERGEGKGKGTTLNVPLEAGTPPETYRRRFDGALEEAVSAFSPDFIVVSAGFDVLAGDPLGGQLLEPPDLHGLTLRVRESAEEACGGRLVTLLEGGYVPERLGAGAVAVIRAMAGIDDAEA